MVSVMADIEFHPIAELFPMMQGREFEELVEDVRSHGLLEPVWLYEGKVLDGRNRMRACNASGLDPEFREYDGDDPVGFVVSLNLHRRHLNESQRAMVGRNMATMKVGNPTGSNQYKRNQSNLPNSMSNGQVAELLNVSESSIKSAKKVNSRGIPELARKVEEGKVKVSVAADVANLPENQQEVIVSLGEKAILRAAKEIRSKKESERRQQRLNKLSGFSSPEMNTEIKYPVILADPPWEYERPVSDSRRIENHYPIMSLDDIKALPVIRLTTDDAILFMWATPPKLAESIQVMEAWGFTYRSCAVWDKQVIGMGYWFRQQTELLLVGTKGRMPSPEPASRVSSLISARRREHSAKPDEVYDIIERMYPQLPRIELFCRSPRPGWAVFGNEYGD